MTVVSVRRFVASFAAIFVVSIAAAWVWAINGRMWFLDPEYPMWVAKGEMIRSCAHGETAIVGDSRAMAAFIPARVGDGVMNFALGGGSPIEAAYLIEGLLNCPSRPKRVFASFGAAILMSAEVYWTRTAPFGFLTFEQMEEVRVASRRLGDASLYRHANSVIHLDDVLENYSYRFSLPSHYFPAMVSAWFITRRDRNLEVLETTLRNRGQHLFGHAARADWASPEASILKFDPPPLIDYYFRRIISKLRAEDIPVYFVSTPLNEPTVRVMRPQLRDELARYLDKVRAQNSNFHILGELLPSLPAEYFGDSEHLNGTGAAVWSERVARRLSELVEGDARSPVLR